MDFLRLESALLLQNGNSFGCGWSDPSSSGNAADDGTVDGSIYGSSSIVNGRGVGIGGDYYSHGVGYGSENHVAKLHTPLDPLLKELKREHASSAGPQDVLASLISKEELEFLLMTASSRTSTTKSSDGSGGRKFSVKSIEVPEDVNNTKKETMDKEPTDLFDVVRAETPLARGGHVEGSPLIASPPPTSHSTTLSSNKSGIHQNLSHKRPFSSHVDNLLQTTPHLRHLSAASTDLSGSGLYDDSKNIFSQILNFNNKDRKISSSDNIDSSSAPGNVDYPTSILRQRANRRASLELASFMRLLSNEMPQEAFVVVEAEVYKKVFSLMQSKTTRSDDRLAGVAALDALLSVPSSNEEAKAIRVSNALSNGLKAPHADYEFLHAVARAIGRMAFGSTNVDVVEFEITRSLEWLQSDRSDRKLAAVLVLSELAKSSPTAFYSKTNTSSTLSGGRGGSMGVLASYLDGLGLSGTNEFLEHIHPVLTDPHPIVRVCAADALSECLKILMDRQQRAMTAPLCKLHSQMMDGLQWAPGSKNNSDDKFTERDNAIKAHGSLLLVTEMLNHSRNFILPRYDEVCAAVLKFTSHPMALIRLELIRIIPQLARRNPDVFGCRYLCPSLDFLLVSASALPPQRSGIDLRPKAILAIGQLALGMSDEDMGGGDITIPTVRIFDKPNPVVKSEDENEVEFHIVEIEDESVFQQRLGDIFNLISESLKRNRLASIGNVAKYRSDVLICFANMVEALGHHATPYVKGIVEDMFRSGLSRNLIGCLHSVAASLPSMQLYIERRLFEEVSFCLAGTRSLNSAYDLFSANDNIRPAIPSLNESTSALLQSTSLPAEPDKETNLMRSMSLASMNRGRPRKRIPSELEVNELSASGSRLDSIAQTTVTAPTNTDDSRIVIDTSTKPEAIDKLILSLQTLRTIGESYMRAHETENGNMLLPFLRDVISLYLDHPSSDVRREAAVTCTLLLLPFGKRAKKGNILSFRLGSVSGSYVEEILQKLLRIAVSDLSPVVRLCVVSGLDERYDPYLVQLSLLPPLFLMLEDETLVMRAGALQLLGRLSRLNPATILPGLRIILTDLILELQCGGDGGGKEAATRLIIFFLREEALQQLVRPFISSIIDSLPLSDDVPRLVSASLEALGELADVAHGSIQPWLRQLIPHILSNVEDQNSSKQKVSLWALGKIAFGTNYVISPYLDYPKLLSQASNILPTTKRASWELRREVFRTFGVLGALDPDRFGTSSTRKGGGKGGGYFVELEEEKDISSRAINHAHGSEIPKMGEWSQLNNQASSVSPQMHTVSDSVSSSNENGKKLYKDSDNDEPAHLYMYEQYAMTAQPVSKLPPARRLSPSDDDFYPTVAVQALMRILRDSSLSNLHGMVMKAVMFIFNALGLKSVPFLKNIVPHILSTIKVCGQHGLREVLLQQVANLSAIVRKHLRPYLPAIFDVVEEFWFTRHLSALCSLVKRVAIAVPDDFNTYVPLLVRQILATIDSTDFSEINFREQAERLDLILQLIQGIKGVLGEYIHLVVPALVKLTDLLIDPEDKNLIQISPPIGSNRSKVAVETVETLSILLETMEMSEGRFSETHVKSSTTLPARVVQPFLRMLGGDVKPNKIIGGVMIDCLCICVRQLGSNRWMSFYHNSTTAVISSWQSKVGIGSIQDEGGELDPREAACYQPRPIDIYKDVVAEMVSNSNRMRWANNIEEHSLPAGLSLENAGPSEASLTGLGEALKPNIARNPPSTIQVQNQIAAHQTNINNLQRAWDVSQRSSREDWDEWLRRFSVQLLREAPSPALRACAELAQAYQPLARELFSAAFACCWVELDDHYRSSLIFSMETVFQADASQISLEILQLLLNLAEFLEKNKKTELPIDISILAELALKCRAYARALHYKEREYIMGRGGSCVEQLIDINKKLDLPEAALGVLQAAKIEIQRHNRSGDHDKMAYSVLNTIDGDKGSWAGDIMYESWLAKLGSWAEAVQLYEQNLIKDPNDVNSILGCMQCYEARGDWEKALELAGRSWGALSGESRKSGDSARRSRRSRRRIREENHKLALKHCAQAAWRLRKWDDLETFSSQLVQGQEHNFSQNSSFDLTSTSKGSRVNGLPTLDYDSAFYRAVINIHQEDWDEAAISIDAARKAMDSRFTALLAESYKRAYPSMVAAQTLSELEEIVSFRQFERSAAHTRLHTTGPSETKKARQHLTDVWRRRLNGCRVDAEVHSEILAVRSLVLGPADEVDATITLSALSRQAEAFQLAERTLLDPLSQMKVSLNSQIFGVDTPSHLEIGLVVKLGESADSLVNKGVVRVRSGPAYEEYCQQLFADTGGEEKLFVQHKLYLAYIKHLWATERKDEAMSRLSLLCNIVDLTTHYGKDDASNDLRIKCWLRYGDWKLALNPPGSDLPDSLATDVLISYKRATDVAVSDNYRAFHSWALINFRLAEQLNDKDRGGSSAKPFSMIQSHVIAAVKGFVRAISVGTKRWSASVQQDMLNLLSCLFKYGELDDVSETINEGLESIEIEAWLGVLPQLLARIHIKSPSVRSVLHPLLVRIGTKHPQAMMYPLSVLLKSPVTDRKIAAESLMNSLKTHSNALIEESLMVSSELIRVAILWLELWHEGLEDASRLYYGEGNVAGMLDVLIPLHTELEKGANSRRELDFLNSFGRDLMDAHNHITEYERLIRKSGQKIPTQGGFMSDPNQAGRSSSPNAEAEAALNQAWDLYYTVFRRINKQLPGMTTLELDQCSPALFNARNLELGVPGSYRVDGSYVKIQKFITSVQVITSKQRPRKITIRGNDGKDYVFLLKGHEDLRQDERVMQLFGLVNALLARDRRTNKHDLNIQRYAIAPLSHNAGVVGWVPHCDTLHCLIRDYREALKIPLNAENREMLALTPNYDSLTAMQKVEVFTEALDRTRGKGNDLYEVLWNKSINSEEWLDRRTNFTRSLAVMSMVGYILGLGDRHPSNLMLDQVSGRVLHIDFGDCFEVAMHREKFPEKVPFRLTRMLVRAMEVSGIEGSYKSTCERTMSVLRDNKDSLVAMLEAFVYDPLISWRLLDQSLDEDAGEDDANTKGDANSADDDQQTTTTTVTSTAVSHANTLPEPIQEEHDEDEDNDESDSEHENAAEELAADNNGSKEETGNEGDHKNEEEDGKDAEARNEVEADDSGKNKEEEEDEKEEQEEQEVGEGDIEVTTKETTAPEPPLTRIAPIQTSTKPITTEEIVPHNTTEPASSMATSHARSLQMYSDMKALAANLSTSSRIASITGGGVSAAAAVAMEHHGSVARSRIGRSLRQKGALLNSVKHERSGDRSGSNEEGEDAFGNNDEALNEKALKVIRRVQDKLTGTDFHSAEEEFVGEPLDVQEQVQRLIVQATSSENLCQLFIGWCAFW